MTGKVLYVGMGDSYIVVILFCINNFFSTKSLLNYICSIYSELPDIQAGLRKGRGTRDQIANIHWIIKKTREFQKNIYFCFIDYPRAFDCVDHNKLWKILQEMGIPAHLTCVLRNLYAGREATVRTRHGNPWLIHVNVWQKPLQYCKVISLQLIKINGKKKVKVKKKKRTTHGTTDWFKIGKGVRQGCILYVTLLI